MILAGAVPAALLALILDGILGVVQKYIHKIFKLVTLVFILLTLGIGFNQIKGVFITQQKILAGFDAEFTARADGLPALLKYYHLPQFKTVELDAGLMYQALHKGRVDIIGGYSTDGRIEVFDLFILEDDQKFFPPYYAAPLVRNQSLEKYPELIDIFKNIEGKMTDSVMRALNYQVDELKKNPRDVAQTFLKSMGLKHALIQRNNPSSMITIGGKKFTEHYILAEIFKQLIENYSKLSVSLKTGLGGTQIAFEALKKGEIDLYPEYTGTALYVILKDEKNIPLANIKNPDSLYHYVQLQSQERFDMTWLGPLGFNNTYALMMTKEKAKRLNIQKISDLKYLQNF
jgi:osmoprotectant transport system permease protein